MGEIAGRQIGEQSPNAEHGDERADQRARNAEGLRVKRQDGRDEAAAHHDAGDHDQKRGKPLLLPEGFKETDHAHAIRCADNLPWPQVRLAMDKIGP